MITPIEEDDTITKKSAAIYRRIKVPSENEFMEKTRKTDDNHQLLN